MKITVTAATIALWLFSSFGAGAQGIAPGRLDSLIEQKATTRQPGSDQTDIIDLVRRMVHKGVGNRSDSGDAKSYKPRVSVVPAAGYTLQTDFAGIVAANATFNTHENSNTSTVVTSFTYTARNQVILPLQTSLWTRGNKYNIVADWRYLYYPSYTFGLGGYTSATNGYIIDFSAIHLHQALLRELAEDMYAGIGYNLDYFWDIYEMNPPGNKATDFETYGYAKTEFASGFTLNFLYDTRKNPINADRGNFVNVVYRPNLTIFGNTANWRSLTVDLRKYIPFPASSRNVLALWSYEWLTVSGKPPYLMLPNTGGDPWSNTGRGYIQGRFRGNNMAYLEAEYRFGLTRNGLLGGVVFGNVESFTEQASNNFETLAPGWGAGLRLKFNKFSRTNVALDYGFGLNGSGGFFVNVGEVF